MEGLHFRFVTENFCPVSKRDLQLLLPPSWRERQHYARKGRYSDVANWFDKNSPRQNETTWELYRRFDPKGTRRIRPEAFFALIPRQWKEQGQYRHIRGRYDDCVAVTRWLSQSEPIAGETSWQLYKRFDPDGAHAMHQAHFYALLPHKWRKQGYRQVTATYKDCIAAEAWFSTNSLKNGESTWELYKRFDPSGKRAMNQAHFFSLIPATWRERGRFRKVSLSYKDCVAAEGWFTTSEPINGETTWELYKRFDPDGQRAMHQAGFFSLLPYPWRTRYRMINAAYKDCLEVEQWLKSAKPINKESAWELYKRFDSQGTRKMHQASFYTLLPESWRRCYSMISCSYKDCMAAEKWFAAETPLKGETLWELYRRFDPNGRRAMNLGQFFGLLPGSWRERKHYRQITASYKNCLAAERWFSTNVPIDGETTWELYKRFDPQGIRAMNQGQFYALLPRSWRARKHYRKVQASYKYCAAADEWFTNHEPIRGETITQLYHRFGPSRTHPLNPSAFQSLLPSVWRQHFRIGGRAAAGWRHWWRTKWKRMSSFLAADRQGRRKG